jgi:hypothetical protein
MVSQLARDTDTSQMRIEIHNAANETVCRAALGACC